MVINPKNLKTSILNFYSLDYYLQVLSGQKRFRVFIIIFLISVIFSIPPSISLVKDFGPLTKDIENKANAFVDDYYPEELEVTIKNGKASSNVSEPYYVSLPKEIVEDPTLIGREDSNSTSKIRVLAIDTKGNAENFESYQSMALLTETSFIYYNDNGINIQSLRDVADLTVNKAKAKEMIGKISNEYHVQYIANAFILALPLLIVIGFFIVILLTILIVSILVWIIFKVNQIKFPFSKIYLYTASIAFIPTIIWNAISLIPVFQTPLLYLGSLTDIIILIIAYLGVLKLKKQPIAPSQI